MRLVSKNVTGNIHETTGWCNEKGIFDIVHMHSCIGGDCTIVVYREHDTNAYAERNELLKLLSDTMWMIEQHEGRGEENDILVDRARELLARIKP